MKLHHLITLFALLACLVVSSPAFAITIVPLDPCLFADFVADIGPVNAFTVATSAYFQVNVYSYDLLHSGTPVAHVIHNYSMVTVPSLNATMDDTFVDLVDSVTVFGHSVSRNAAGIIGIQGVIVSAVHFDGTTAYGIKGHYITTSFGGSDRFCAFLQ
jgi:hypothetical protein